MIDRSHNNKTTPTPTQYDTTLRNATGMTTAVIVAGKEGIRVAGQGGEKPWW